MALHVTYRLQATLVRRVTVRVGRPRGAHGHLATPLEQPPLLVGKRVHDVHLPLEGAQRDEDEVVRLDRLLEGVVVELRERRGKRVEVALLLVVQDLALGEG